MCEWWHEKLVYSAVACIFRATAQTSWELDLRITRFAFLMLFAAMVNNSFAQEMNFEIDSLEPVEVYFVEPHSEISGMPWQNKEISFTYKYLPVSDIVEKIFQLIGISIEGLEPLSDRLRVVAMKKVTVLKAVTILLKCEGYRLVPIASGFRAVEDTSIDRNSCLI
jgi:hypothetical protein